MPRYIAVIAWALIAIVLLVLLPMTLRAIVWVVREGGEMLMSIQGDLRWLF